jgi:predicted PolB exonuclease-like 3'-5' exonuclease
MTWLVFDIETVPDVELGRRLYKLEGLADAQVARAMFAQSRAATGSDFLPHEQHRVVAIACALRTREQFRIWSLGDEEASEAELITRFYDGIEKYTPDLVSWNGGGFDLPVLHYRALKAGVQAPRYWETGDEDTAFRYNNYLSRYHWRHLDLMDVLAAHNGRAPRSWTWRRCSGCRASSASPATRCGTRCWRANWPQCGAIARPTCSTRR